MQGLPVVLGLIQELDGQGAVQVDTITSLADAISALDELLDERGKTFAHNFEKLMNLLEKMIAGEIVTEAGDRVSMLQVIYEVFYKYPKLLKLKKYRITRLFKISLEVMALMLTEPTQEWMNPPNGYDQTGETE
jgi:uncharacterized coiled-coil protein SlyX